MKITIEKRTNKAGDKQTIRLVSWLGSSTDDTGKVKHDRKREQLDQFLYSNPQNKKETMQLVEQIRAKRITEDATGKHGFADASKAKTRFYELFDAMMEAKNAVASKTNYLIWSDCRYQLKQYWPDENVLLSRINVESLKGVRTFFDIQAKTKTGQPIKKATANAYFNKVRSVFKHAFDKGYIQVNLLNDVKTISVGESERTYLTIEQVRQLVETPCRYDPLKRAFLFSCLTGLRWSDIFKLDWSELSQLNGVHRITFNQKKQADCNIWTLQNRLLICWVRQKNKAASFKVYAIPPMPMLSWCAGAWPQV